jgi:hypothetical protein
MTQRVKASQINRIEMRIREVRTSTLDSINPEQKLPLESKTIKSVYVIENTGNIEDTYQLDLENRKGDNLDALNIHIYLDKNADGELSEEEKKQGVITQITLPMAESAMLITIGELPEGIVETDKLHMSLAVANSKGRKPKGKGDVIVSFTAENLSTKLETVLTAAKSHCDTGQLLTGATFANIRLEDMASGECVTFQVQSKNVSQEIAYKVILKQTLPDFISYVKNSLRVCSNDKTCQLVSKTDSSTDNDNASYDANTGVVMIGSELMEIQAGAVIRAEYRLKIN